MRKTIPILILFILLLTSCNFPLSKPTPDLNIVSTKVAATLSAVQTQAQPTAPIAATEDPLSPTMTPSLEPTSTPTEQPSPTPTATPPAGDPAITLGEPGFFDTFSSGISFGLSNPYEDEAVLISVENGAMVFKSKRINNGIRWRLTSRNPQDLYLEGQFNVTRCSGADQYGLIVRAPSYSDGIGYYFGVTCSGQYYLLLWDKEGQNTVVSLASGDSILSGSGQINRLGIMADGDTIRLYANGELLKELTDKGLTDKGYIGAFVSAREDQNFTVQLEELKLWTLQ